MCESMTFTRKELEALKNSRDLLERLVRFLAYELAKVDDPNALDPYNEGWWEAIRTTVDWVLGDDWDEYCQDVADEPASRFLLTCDYREVLAFLASVDLCTPTLNFVNRLLEAIDLDPLNEDATAEDIQDVVEVFREGLQKNSVGP